MASKVVHVSNTKIFVGVANGRQLTAYEMAVELPSGAKGNAMILPVPGRAQDVKLIDMSHHREFFTDLASLFIARSRSMTKGSNGPDKDLLEVQEIGDYLVSVADSPQDIRRINPEVFTLSTDTESVLDENYSNGFGFVVAQLKKTGSIHPLAYSIPFNGDQMFVPTRHAHGNNGKMLPKWDHDIFHQTGRDPWVRPIVGGNGGQHHRVEGRRNVDYVRHKTSAEVASFIDPALGFDRHRYYGRLPNIDLLIPVS